MNKVVGARDASPFGWRSRWRQDDNQVDSMCRRQLLIGKQADVRIHPSWLRESPEHNLMKWETTVRSRSAKKNGQLGVIQTGQSKELIPWNQEDERLRLLREALSNTPFIRLGE